MKQHKNYYRVWTDEKRDQLAILWCLEGWDHERIAKVLDCTPTAIGFQIRMLGLRLTPQAIKARRKRGIYRGRPQREEKL